MTPFTWKEQDHTAIYFKYPVDNEPERSGGVWCSFKLLRESLRLSGGIVCELFPPRPPPAMGGGVTATTNGKINDLHKEVKAS